jgi:glycosyltransferase involved in cell wall biosynthesis
VRILFVNRYFHPDHSATSQMLSDLAFHLADGGHDVAVVTSRQRYEDPAAGLPERETVRGVEIYRVNTPRFGRARLAGRLFDYLGFYAAATAQLLALARPGDVIVAKTDPPLISVPAAWVARRRRARLVNWLQDLFPEVALALGVKGMDGPAGRLLQHVRNWSLRQADMNFAIGERMRERLLGLGIPASRIVVIPNWADGEAITPVRHEDNPLRREWGLEGRFVVGYSGNLGRAHEFETILGAAERLRDDPVIAFLFIGEGAQAAGVRAAAAQRGLVNVHFRPYQPRETLRYSLGVADVHLVVLRPELEGLIVPSKTYGCLAAGRPVIFVGDPEGEIASFIGRASLGWHCPVGDSSALRECIESARAGDLDATALRVRRTFDSHHDLYSNCSRFAILLEGCTR